MSAFITTFYSFKGGVGRTTLLVNAGAYLALRGRKVLLWDLDLEAPGLHRIPGLTPKNMPKTGFMEWLADWQPARSELNAASIQPLLDCVRPAPAAELLSILPAHGADADLARLYQRIDWHALLVSDPDKGAALFRALLQALAEHGDYQHILLDSRTGITDLGGAMTVLLPHASVLVGNYSHQSSAGLLAIYQALQNAVDGKLAERGELGELQRLLVASPVPNDQEKSRRLRVETWGKAFAIAISDPPPWLEVPFDSRLLFSEDLLVLSDADSPPARVYAQLAQQLDDLRLARENDSADLQRAAQAFPDARQQQDSHAQRGKTFEERIARLLSLLDYQVEREQLIGSNRVDLLAKKRAGFKEECYLVECKDWQKPVPKTALEKFSIWLNDPQARLLNAQGMFVAHAYAPAALSYAKAQNILALTPAELEHALFDFRPYLDRLIRQFESDALAQNYVEQRVLLESGGPHPEEEGEQSRSERQLPPILPHAQAWARGQGKRLWLLLGDYGSGKSAFFQRFAYALAQAAQTDPNAPIPLAIDLKRIPNAVSLQTLLQEHMREMLNWHGNPEIFLHLLHAGRIVLLLDSFDEMGTATVGRSIEAQFRQLATPATYPGDSPSANRVLITCRTHFFRDQQQAKRTADGAFADSLVSEDSALGKLARSFDAAIDELPLFNAEQIAEFMRRRLGAEKAAAAQAFIEDTYDLPSLAARPIMLDMMVKSLPDLMAAGGRINPARLYYTYTNLWLRDHSGGNYHSTPDQRQRLLERLALELWGLEQHRIHYLELERLLKDCPAELRQNLDPARLDLELRTAAFLTRTADGYYSFSHKSFREYFYARYLLRAVREDASTPNAVELSAAFSPSFRHGLAESRDRDVARSLHAPSMAMDPGDPCRGDDPLRLKSTALASTPRCMEPNAVELKQGFRPPLPAGKPPRSGITKASGEGWGEGRSKNQIPIPDYDSSSDLLSAALNTATITPECVGFLADLLEEQDQPQLVEATKNLLAHPYRPRTSENALLLAYFMAESQSAAEGANRPASIAGEAVAYPTKMAAYLPEHAQLQGAQLAGMDLSSAWLRGARFDQADLRKINLSGVEAAGANFSGADLRGALLQHGQFQAAIFAQAKLMDSDGQDGDFTQASFRQADLTAARFMRAKLPQADLSAAHCYAARFAAADLTDIDWSGAETAFATAPAALSQAGALPTSHPPSLLCALQRGHSSAINCIAFSPDGRTIATASSDNSAALWDAQSAQQLRVFNGHKDYVRSVAFSPDGRTIATASDDKSAALWDAQSAQQLRVFNGHSNWVTSVAFSPDGRTIATASFDGTVLLWDIDSGKRLALLLSSPQGWLLVDGQNRWQGAGAGLEWLAYMDASDHSLRPTLWYAVDLPQLRREPDALLLT